MPSMRYALAAYYVTCTSEASSNLARYDGVRYGPGGETAKSWHDAFTAVRSADFGDEVRRRILLGTFALSAGYYGKYYGKAQTARANVGADFARLFRDVDVLAGPTMPTVAFRLGELADPLSMYLADVLTVPANLAGVPAISVPCGDGRRPARRAPADGPALRRRGRHRPRGRVRGGDGMTDVVIGLEVHCRPRHADQALLPLLDRLPRRRAEHPRLPGLPRAARHHAGREPGRDRVRAEGREGLPLRDPRGVRVLAEELLLPRPAQGLPDHPVRPPPRARRVHRDRGRGGRREARPPDPDPRRGGPRAARPQGERRPGPVLARRLQPLGRAADRNRDRARHELAQGGAAPPRPAPRDPRVPRRLRLGEGGLAPRRREHLDPGPRAGRGQEHLVVHGRREGPDLRDHAPALAHPARGDHRARDPALRRGPRHHHELPLEGRGARLPLLPRAGPAPAPGRGLGRRHRAARAPRGPARPVRGAVRPLGEPRADAHGRPAPGRVLRGGRRRRPRARGHLGRRHPARRARTTATGRSRRSTRPASGPCSRS